MPEKNHSKIRWGILAVVLICDIYVWSALWPSFKPRLVVSFFDVGQGDAILIQAPRGRTALIDGGPGKGVLRELARALPLFGRIDLLIETHPDTDHAGGLPDAASKYGMLAVLKPCISSDNPYDRALDQEALRREAKIVCAAAGQEIDLGGGARLEILSAGTEARSDTNSSSVVARLVYGESSFLFAGDATERTEKYLLYTAGGKLAADVYKVSHHGSRESNDEEFLRAVSPELSVISVGADNRYGHPHAEVLSLLAEAGSAILRTDLAGTIVLESDGENISAKLKAQSFSSKINK